MWKAVEVSTEKADIGKTKERRGEGRIRKKRRSRVPEGREKEKDHSEMKNEENNGSKEVSKRVGNLK